MKKKQESLDQLMDKVMLGINMLSQKMEKGQKLILQQIQQLSSQNLGPGSKDKGERKLEEIEEEKVEEKLKENNVVLTNKENSLDRMVEMESEEVVEEQFCGTGDFTMVVEKSEKEEERSLASLRVVFEADSMELSEQAKVLPYLHIPELVFVEYGGKVDYLGDDYIGIEHKIVKNVFGFHCRYEENCVPYYVFKCKRQLGYKNRFRNTILEIVSCTNKIHYDIRRFQFDPGKDLNFGRENSVFAFKIIHRKTDYKSLVYKLGDFKNLNSSELVDINVALRAKGKDGVGVILDKLVICHSDKAVHKKDTQNFVGERNIHVNRKVVKRMKNFLEARYRDYEKEKLLVVMGKEIEYMRENISQSYAKMENVMVRTTHDAENSKKIVIQRFAKGLLDVAYNLGRDSSVVKKSFSKMEEKGEGSHGSNFGGNGDYFCLNEKVKMQTAEHQRHLLRMLDEYKARELDIGFTSIVTLLVRIMSALALRMRLSRSLFSQLWDSHFRAPMPFHDSAPLCRILSRVSIKLSIVNPDIAFSFNTYYFASGTEPMGINGITKSFVANHLDESILGSLTIRAFKDLLIRYRPIAPLDLRGSNCTFEGGHQIGSAGTTGIGKTTLIGTLFRLAEPCRGQFCG